jgi:protein-S-isoprenylcysteine O-methyltransferase Ste14
MAATNASAPSFRGAGAKVVSLWLLLLSFFLVTGGSFTWWEAWAYCALLLGPMIVFVACMARRDPEFLVRRTKLREKEPAQRRIVASSLPAMVAALVIPGLDHRFGWSEPPIPVIGLALAISLLGYLTILRAFLENRWAGRTVETYPGQTVISTGPYAIVRHPMYAGSMVLYLSTPVALGSRWGLIPALAFVPVYFFRIRNEEEILVRELPGYAEYRRNVRYRLVPFIW